MGFIKSFCCFALCDGMIYSEKVCASMEILLDLQKKGTQNGYYEENMRALLLSIPLHESMRSVVFRIFSDYGVGDWRYLDLLIHDSVQSMICFRMFLLGTHVRIGKQSNILKISGENGILQNIFSFLKDEICGKTMAILENYDHIIWWSPIREDSKHIMQTLHAIANLLDAMIQNKHAKRFVLYQKFKQKHDSRIVDKYIAPKFDPIF